MGFGSLVINKASRHGHMFSVIALLFILFAFLTIGCLREGDDANMPVMQLTFGGSNDEDGAFALADDGTVYFAWMSDRAGNVDIWIKSSKDGIKWSDPWPAVQTPVDELMNNMVRTSDGRYHLTGRRGPWHTGQFATWDSCTLDLVNWTQPVQWTDPGAAGYW